MKSFSSKIEERIVKQFFDAIATTLVHWTSLVEHQAVASTDFRLPLRQMNAAISFLRESFKTLHLEYKHIEQEHGINPLDPKYLTAYSEMVKKIDDSLQNVRQVAYKYGEILDKCKEQKYDTTKYITPKNIKAIDRMFEMTTSDVLKLLEDSDLLGF